jgi:hypothetical protein
VTPAMESHVKRPRFKTRQAPTERVLANGSPTEPFPVVCCGPSANQLAWLTVHVKVSGNAKGCHNGLKPVRANGQHPKRHMSR